MAGGRAPGPVAGGARGGRRPAVPGRSRRGRRRQREHRRRLTDGPQRRPRPGGPRRTAPACGTA
ncbi:SSU ribosomal protein S6p [Actinacidiphila bryophytorum]|uniref:SSU ribosomal protein S6p n=1 Tax=Actinacidiphila bryophytorum TaxID=1436133 RepID=A0A9W4MIA2_9ACTN|nr:SSU ribosomal protein S6p [Actinacidiphila bryophytorum]